jgi:hypothetical protein
VGIMHEMDDRLAGDAVWELFASPAPATVRADLRFRSYRRWLIAAGFVAAGWIVLPPLAVVAACLFVAAPDFRKGRQLARSIPSKAGGEICARFTQAWGAWKVGVTAFLLMFVSITLLGPTREQPGVPPAFIMSLLLCIAGFILSAFLTARGLLLAYRSEMRVWIGEGVNRARTLLLAMLIVVFAFVVLGPLCVGLSRRFPRASDSAGDGLLGMLVLWGCLGAGPVVLLLILDRIARRIIADRPGKFGPKVPAVGKWN